MLREATLLNISIEANRERKEAFAMHHYVRIVDLIQLLRTTYVLVHYTTLDGTLKGSTYDFVTHFAHFNHTT